MLNTGVLSSPYTICSILLSDYPLDGCERLSAVAALAMADHFGLTGIRMVHPNITATTHLALQPILHAGFRLEFGQHDLFFHNALR